MVMPIAIEVNRQLTKRFRYRSSFFGNKMILQVEESYQLACPWKRKPEDYVYKKWRDADIIDVQLLSGVGFEMYKGD